MFIPIKYQLECIQEDLAMKKPIEKIPLNGTLIVINGSIDFKTPDGFIQFMKLALDQIPAAYGKQNPKWQTYLDNIFHTAEKMQDKYTKFTGSSKEEFQEYCKRLSTSISTEVKPLTVPTLDRATDNNLLAFMEKHVAKGNNRGFYYTPEENVEKEFMHDLMTGISDLKFDKRSARKFDISYHLTSSGYHEHVHDALNSLLGSVVYAINCNSTKKQETYSYDTQKIHNDLNYVGYIIKDIEYVI